VREFFGGALQAADLHNRTWLTSMDPGVFPYVTLVYFEPLAAARA